METLSTIIVIIVIYYLYKKFKNKGKVESVEEFEARKMALDEEVRQTLAEIDDKIENSKRKVELDRNLAIFTIVWTVASSDGEWSEDEIESACKHPKFKEAMLAVNVDEFFENVKSGVLRLVDSINYLKSLDRQERIDCMVICFATVIADGELTDEEKRRYLVVLNNFDDITQEEVYAAYQDSIKPTFDMNADYAFFTLVWWVGNSDGKFTEEEIEEATRFPSFLNALNNIDLDLFIDNWRQGKVEASQAAQTMQSQDRSLILDCLVVCLATIAADIDISEEEKSRFFQILNCFEDISYDEVVENYKEQIG